VNSQPSLHTVANTSDCFAQRPIGLEEERIPNFHLTDRELSRAASTDEIQASARVTSGGAVLGNSFPAVAVREVSGVEIIGIELQIGIRIGVAKQKYSVCHFVPANVSRLQRETLGRHGIEREQPRVGALKIVTDGCRRKSRPVGVTAQNDVRITGFRKANHQRAEILAIEKESAHADTVPRAAVAETPRYIVHARPNIQLLLLTRVVNQATLEGLRRSETCAKINVVDFANKLIRCALWWVANCRPSKTIAIHRLIVCIVCGNCAVQPRRANIRQGGVLTPDRDCAAKNQRSCAGQARHDCVHVQQRRVHGVGEQASASSEIARG